MKPAVLVLGCAFALAWYPKPLTAQSGVKGAVGTTETCAANLADMEALTAVNRTASPLSDGDRIGARLDKRPGDGVAWLKGCTFSGGRIEFDVRGEDLQGQSFVGIAFHGVNDSTYDAVYLRPFNFQATDPARRAHAVQYVSHPRYTWSVLRASHPGVYENAVQPAPNPNAWVHVRVMVSDPKVSVFVGEGQEPDLVVDCLSDRKQGQVGLWVGNGSRGDFANLVITQTP